MHSNPYDYNYDGPMDPNMIEDTEKTNRVLALWVRRDRTLIQQRFVAGKFEAEVIEELARTHNIYLGDEYPPWPVLWQRLMVHGPKIAAQVQRTIINRVLDRERVG